MFCPRCGRPVNAEANFCGGCGLSRIEIEKYLSKTAPQQPVQEAPQQEVPQQTVQDVPQQEAVFTPPAHSEPAQPKAEEIPDVQIPSVEIPKAEHVFWQSEPAKAEEPAEKATENTADNATTSAYTDNNCTYAYSYKKAESTDCAAHGSNTQSTAQNTANTADAVFTAAAEEVKKEAPLTTVDFIWMLVLSSLPVIGLIYLIYLAVQNNNINKRSFARATLIVAVFAFVITFVFAIGVAIAGLF